MPFKKWQKPPKKWQKLSEVEIKAPVIEEETPVSTVIENEMNDVEEAKPTKRKIAWEIVWNWSKTVYQAPKWRIKFEAQVAPVPMFLLPAHIRSYLQSRWLGTNVWRRDKEWLERHNVDMKIIEELKQFLSSRG